VPASVPTATNDASQTLYGPRTRSYTNVAAGSLSTYQSDISNFWVNRYGSIQYLPLEIQTSYAVLKGSAVDDGVAMLEFMQLLWPSTALWNRLTIKYKPTGATSTQTIQMVATRRLITADPSNTTIRLTVKSGADNQSFELDSSTYGILDTNRLA
jgi:lipoprotein-anchoring transpeptidase ErfK/SrfK